LIIIADLLLRTGELLAGRPTNPNWASRIMLRNTRFMSRRVATPRRAPPPGAPALAGTTPQPAQALWPSWSRHDAGRGRDLARSVSPRSASCLSSSASPPSCSLPLAVPRSPRSAAIAGDKVAKGV